MWPVELADSRSVRFSEPRGGFVGGARLRRFPAPRSPCAPSQARSRRARRASATGRSRRRAGQPCGARGDALAPAGRRCRGRDATPSTATNTSPPCAAARRSHRSRARVGLAQDLKLVLRAEASTAWPLDELGIGDCPRPDSRPHCSCSPASQQTPVLALEHSRNVILNVSHELGREGTRAGRLGHRVGGDMAVIRR